MTPPRLAAVWILWILLIAAVSLPPIAFKHHSRGLVHIALHLAAFAVAGALAVFAFRRASPYPVLLVFALAISLEWLQTQRFGNRLEIRDICLNLLGAVFGCWQARRYHETQ